MALDPNIPYQAGLAGVVDLNGIRRQASDMRARDQQIAQQQQRMDAEQAEQQRKQQAATSLADLVAQRAAGGKWDTQSPQFQNYVQNDPDGAMEILKGMDQEKRDQVKEGIKDLSAAVRWAKTPEQWAKVQQHYGQFDPQLAAVPFEQREQALISLGQMGEYLEQTAPELKSVEPGGGLYSVGKDGSGFKVVVSPNDGSGTLGAPVTGNPGGVREGATATNPQTGQKIQFRGGQWVPVGGAGSNASGDFQAAFGSGI